MTRFTALRVRTKLRHLSIASACLLVTPGLAQDEEATRAGATGAPAVRSTVVTQPSTAGQLTVILTDVVTSPLFDVPGVAGVKFCSFDRPAISPNGLNWIITADSDADTAEDDFLIVNGAVVLRENDSPPYVDPMDTINSFDQGVSINDAGQFGFSHFTDDDSTENDYVVRGEPGGTFTLIAREGFQVPGAPMGWIAGFVNTSPITATGEVWYETESVDGTPTMSADDNNLVMRGTTILAQNGVTIPAGQAGGAAETWESFDFEDLYVSADGMHYILLGDLTGDTATDDVVVVDGTVVLQEGHPIPGGPADIIDSSGISSVYMHHSGHWMSDGDFDVTNDAWAVLDGVIVAQEGMPIHEGASGTFDSTFFANTCNAGGDFVIGGSSDNADTTRDAVILMNNKRVLVREGDGMGGATSNFSDALCVTVM